MEKYTTYKPIGIKWIGEIPEHWDVHKIRYLFQEKSQKGYPNEPILSATQKYGVIPQDLYENRKLNLVKNIVLEYHPIKKTGLKTILKMLQNEGFAIETKEDMNGDEGLIFVIGKKSFK